LKTEVILTGTGVPHPRPVGLPDVAMTCWVQQQLADAGPLIVVADEALPHASPVACWSRTTTTSLY
jgi:hypothetical protein